MRRVFKTRAFARIARKAGLSNDALCKAVTELAQGLHDGDLGQSVYKKRIALGSRGKSSGARTLVAMNHGTRWFFLYGFKKNERANISDAELEALQEIAKILLARSDIELDLAVTAGELEEICNGNEG
ncbi:MAG: type II toxin-antitoxin system RelE/ParE family toxin [Betaproteobacteria bacterium]|nr:type II toxin-antitoxin system RelE/ParE family toxin [Betaproteobacteria bacterium]